MKLPIALQLYSVRDVMEKDFEGTLSKVAELGYDGVEFAGLFGFSAEKVRELMQKYKLVPISAHVPYYDMLRNTTAVLSDYKKIGCEYVAVPYLTEECRPGTDGFDSTIKGIRKIGEAAKGLGIQLLYHNHDFEFVKLGNNYALDVLYDTIPAALLQTELDTCWVRVGGEDPTAYIKKYSGRTPVVHLKDYVGQKGSGPVYQLIGMDEKESAADEKQTFEFRPVGYGVQDFKGIVSASEKSGAKWLVVEQDEPSMGKSSLECAKMSIDYLKKI